MSAGNAKPFGDDFDPGAAIDPSRALVPHVLRVNEVRVRKGFWPKLRKVASRIPFAADVLSIWFCARDPATPLRAKAVLFGALAYFVSPVDAIPDVLAGVGFTDDAAVIAAAIAIIGAHLKPAHKQAAREALEKMGRD